MSMIGHVQIAYRAPDRQVMQCKFKTRIDGRSEQDKSSEESLFIKTVCPSLCEGEQTVAIRRAVGDIVPEITVVCERSGTMIQRDAGSVGDGCFDQEVLTNTIAEMQMLSVDRIQELAMGGVVVTDCKWLQHNIKEILHHETLEMLLEDGDSFKDKLSELRACIGLLRNAFRDVESLRLQKTLVHRDLGFSNLGSRRKDGKQLYCFFDWSESFLEHLLCILEDFLKNNKLRNEIDYETTPSQIS